MSYNSAHENTWCPRVFVSLELADGMHSAHAARHADARAAHPDADGHARADSHPYALTDSHCDADCNADCNAHPDASSAGAGAHH